MNEAERNSILAWLGQWRAHLPDNAVTDLQGLLGIPASSVVKLPSKLPWTAEINGADLVVRNIKATCFGGAYDSGDTGETESGVMNDGRDPDLFGVALPIRSIESATRDSPLAFKGLHIPWKTVVTVWRDADGESTALRCILIDNGPDVSRFPTHALDLNPNAALHFSPGFDVKKIADQWSGDGFSYRIVGGAKFVS